MTSQTVESVGTQSQTQSQFEDGYGNETTIEDEDLTEVDLSGRVLAGIYRLQSKIGAGSFGHVYLCENMQTQQEWAMKIESKAKSDNSQLLIEVFADQRQDKI